MGFTTEDRYLSLPTLKTLHLAKKESHILAAANCATCRQIYDFSQLDNQVQSVTEVHEGAQYLEVDF